MIKKHELNIHDIPIEHITKQYLEFMDMFKMLDLDVAGEFVVMAANLIYIKSRSLLPANVQPPEGHYFVWGGEFGRMPFAEGEGAAAARLSCKPVFMCAARTPAPRRSGRVP